MSYITPELVNAVTARRFELAGMPVPGQRRRQYAARPLLARLATALRPVQLQGVRDLSDGTSPRPRERTIRASERIAS